MKLFLTGGFLGSGKTTAISNACKLSLKENKKVAVITNDQGELQVDSMFIKQTGFPVLEVSDGCFCCNFNQLNEHISHLLLEYRPDIIFAESVGSCTDLVATIVKPLAEIHPGFDLVITVFADAALLLAITEGRAGFISDNIHYIFKKQLEEADIIVLNKADLLTGEELKETDNLLHAEFPGKTIIHQDSRLHKDILNWLEVLNHFTSASKRPSLEIDYDRYAAGEAAMAWADQLIEIKSPVQNAFPVASQIISDIHERLILLRWPVGHLKFFVQSATHSFKTSYTLTGADIPDFSSAGPCGECTVLINARVETDPENLRQLIRYALEGAAEKFRVKIKITHEKAFTPGYPRPLHRIQE